MKLSAISQKKNECFILALLSVLLTITDTFNVAYAVANLLEFIQICIRVEFKLRKPDFNGYLYYPAALLRCYTDSIAINWAVFFCFFFKNCLPYGNLQ